jgi:hypothetical protein
MADSPEAISLVKKEPPTQLTAPLEPVPSAKSRSTSSNVEENRVRRRVTFDESMGRKDPISNSRKASLPVSMQCKRPLEDDSSQTSKRVCPLPPKVKVDLCDISKPATYLVTNTHDFWSNYCVALGNDGNIDLLNNTTHASVPSSLVSAASYTSSCASKGAWIYPGQLALVHKDPRRNRPLHTQVTLISYEETMSRRPYILDLKPTPHHSETKFTAMTAGWWKETTERTFMTGGTVPISMSS